MQPLPSPPPPSTHKVLVFCNKNEMAMICGTQKKNSKYYLAFGIGNVVLPPSRGKPFSDGANLSVQICLYIVLRFKFALHF